MVSAGSACNDSYPFLVPRAAAGVALKHSHPPHWGPMSLPEGWVMAGWQAESGQAWIYRVRRQGQAGDFLYALKRLKNPTRRERFRLAANRVVLEGDPKALERFVKVFAHPRPGSR